MVVPATVLGALLLLPQTPAAASHATRHTAPHHQAAAAAPAAARARQPLTAAEMEKELQARFAAAPFAGETVESQLADGNITLSGTVHNAEHKGLATELARQLAEKGGWPQAHVYNRMRVELPPLALTGAGPRAWH